MWPPLRTTLAALAAGAVAVALAPGLNADAKTVDETYPVPASGAYTVSGHGWGHGHGMSQYGARGAARQGLSYQQILGFYYPGTLLGATTNEIRVLVSADTSADVVVGATAGLAARDISTGEVVPIAPAAGVSKWRLQPDGAKNVLAFFDSSWHDVRTFAGDAEFLANGLVTLFLPFGSRTYRGALRAAAPSTGSSARDTVNVLSIDDYVKGVVPAEMPSSWETEAVRAQAVAARTYAAWSRSTRASSSYQICDTSSCQVYAGAGGEDPRASAAVDATAGQILTFLGQPAFSQFSSSSGGWTSAGSVPYLVSQADPYETGSGNPYSTWSVSLTAKAIAARYPSIGTLQQIHVSSREGGGDWQGRVWKLTLDGTKGNVEVSGDSFRSAFGLRSTYFTLGEAKPRSTPILDRWTAIGGDASPVGPIAGLERAIEGGRAQDFAAGAIYWSKKYGAWELYGPVLAAYQAKGESTSKLGVPRRNLKLVLGGSKAVFEGGAIFSGPVTGTVILKGPIARKYVGLNGPTSALGWPVRPAVKKGRVLRAKFEHGVILWNKRTHRFNVVMR